MTYIPAKKNLIPAILVPTELPAPMNGKHYTYRDLAAVLGISHSAVKGMATAHGAYSRTVAHSPVVSANIETVRALAAKMGIHPAPCRQPKPHCWHGGNFATHEEEVARMLELRAEGYSNSEIAAKIGRKPLTVLRNIGAQPDDLSKKNRRLAARQRAERNHARTAYVLQREVNEHNKLIAAYNADLDAIASAEQTLAEMRSRAQEKMMRIQHEQPRIQRISGVAGVPVLPIAQHHVN